MNETKYTAHSSYWNYLTIPQIASLFDTSFPNDITIKPNMAIAQKLQALEAGTLELLENRTFSTVYRIRDTGIVYQLCQPEGRLLEFDDYEDYLEEDPGDNLITAYVVGELIHKLEQKGNEVWVHRIKTPRFRARYTVDNRLSDIVVEEWVDPAPAPIEQLRLVQKAARFLARSLK